LLEDHWALTVQNYKYSNKNKKKERKETSIYLSKFKKYIYIRQRNISKLIFKRIIKKNK
jgi:hypothetical protein